MATRKKKSCKHGKLKRPFRTKNGGKRNCKKSSKKSSKKRSKKRSKFNMQTIDNVNMSQPRTHHGYLVDPKGVYWEYYLDNENPQFASNIQIRQYHPPDPNDKVFTYPLQQLIIGGAIFFNDLLSATQHFNSQQSQSNSMDFDMTVNTKRQSRRVQLSEPIVYSSDDDDTIAMVISDETRRRRVKTRENLGDRSRVYTRDELMENATSQQKQWFNHGRDGRAILPVNWETYLGGRFKCGSGLRAGGRTKAGISWTASEHLSCYIFNDLMFRGCNSTTRDGNYRIQCIENLLPLTLPQLNYFIDRIAMTQFNRFENFEEEVKRIRNSRDDPKAEILEAIWRKIEASRNRQPRYRFE